MIAAGVNAKALSTYMGHAGIQITLDLYGHLMPGNESEAAAQLDAYLDRAAAGRRLRSSRDEASQACTLGCFPRCTMPRAEEPDDIPS